MLTLREKLKRANQSADGYLFPDNHGEDDGHFALSAVHDILGILDDMITRIEKLEDRGVHGVASQPYGTKGGCYD